jgi:2-oxoglutarate ferredoxin oxidoreductase subunit beta
MSNDNPPLTLEAFGHYETAWCPGCGNFGILTALKQALVQAQLPPDRICLVSGIGQAAKTPHYLNAHVFNGLHGRALPVATGIALANPDLTVIVESGDGCVYGEGGNHFLAAIRRNIGVTLLVHDNQVYGLTKGQASPTSWPGMVTKAQPHGVFASPFNPVGIAIALRANFVARGFSGDPTGLAQLIRQALAHPGFAFVEILQPCVSFNKVNTFKWYKEHSFALDESYDPTDWAAAMKMAFREDDRLPLGVLWKTNRPPYEAHFPAVASGLWKAEPPPPEQIARLFDAYR